MTVPGWLPLAVFLAFPVAPAFADTADEIHWTLIGQTAVTFDWRAGSDTLFYGPTTAYGSSVVASPPNVLPFSSPGPFREAKLTGLTQDTVYHYSIGAGGADHTFRTPPPHGSSGFRIVVQGDIGAAKDFVRVAPIQTRIASLAPRFVFMVGDLTYANSVGIASVDAHFNDMMAWSRDAAYMPAWGNHEWETPSVDDLANYKGRFDLPNGQTSPGAPASGCCGEDWYWFDYGNVRFISIPEPFLGAWNDWAPKVVPIMDAAQADPAIRFIVTFGHRPAYSSGYHYGEPSLQTKIAALAASHSKYVLNLNGHSHDYERSYAQSGVVHVTAGTGGSALEPESGACKWTGGCPPPAWSAFRAMHHVVVALDFSDSSIQGTVYCGPADAVRNDVACVDGSVFDSFRVPDARPVVTAPATAAVVKGVPLTVQVQVTDPDGDPVASLTADLSGLPPGATFSPAADRLSGTLAWTPGPTDAGTYAASFLARNSLAGSASTSVTVTDVINRSPVASLSLSPPTGNAALTVTANAAGSIDPDGLIASYTFDFGDGAIAGPQLEPTATHTYFSGEYNVSVSATDNAGAIGGASAHVISAVVPPGPNLTGNPSFETALTGWGGYNGATYARTAGGFDGGYACSTAAGAASGSFGINDSPNWVASAPQIGARYRVSAWVRSGTATGQAKLRVTEYLGSTKIGSTQFSAPVTLSPGWRNLTIDFITGASGSTLDIQIVDFPVVPGEVFVVDNVSIRDITGLAVGVEDPPAPDLAARAWVTPMPVTSRGRLGFASTREGPALIEIFDLFGRRMGTLLDAPSLGPGRHEVSLDGAATGETLRAGLYLYRIRLAEGTLSGRFVVAR